MTALVGHELRVPLAAALLYVGIARREAQAVRSATALDEALSVVGSELQRLERLVSRVVELEERGRAVIRPRLVDLAAVVGRTVAEALTIEDGGRPTVTVKDAGAMVGWWDDIAAEEVLRNLISNAIRFGESQPIHITLESIDRGARIVVRDQGRGIAAAERRRIFERGVHTSRRRGGGLGLGLWLVRELVRAHRGRVSVASARGRGATFTVILREIPPPGTSRGAAIRASTSSPGARPPASSPTLSANRLLAFSRDLVRAETFDDLFTAARDEVKASAGYEHVWFMVADADRPDELRLVDFSGENRDTVWKVAPVLKVKGDRFLEELVASDGPVVIPDARADPRTDKRMVAELRNRTLINIPLRLRETPLGIFGMGTFGDEGCRVPSERELDYLVGMAGQIAVAAGRLQFQRPWLGSRAFTGRGA